ncbi:hypothetical protein chiPu_0014447 [Chiloscyllium punctatum]|uniref:Uncharacterized protein n=1 Tax=Chiloscyllium punctatum TaxID=137246 RepID=A0A401SZZ6_CHIPU|nr:hypothetical protein [Chiloscyllium punctatum]
MLLLVNLNEPHYDQLKEHAVWFNQQITGRFGSPSVNNADRRSLCPAVILRLVSGWFVQKLTLSLQLLLIDHRFEGPCR